VIKATVSSKGQIVIPKPVRDRLRLKAGTELVMDVRGETLVMKRTVKQFPDWHAMRGMLRGPNNLLKDLRQERRAELARDDARIQGS
jgi:AbrB family looped-hinge helix DNA binding protein